MILAFISLSLYPPQFGHSYSLILKFLIPLFWYPQRLQKKLSRQIKGSKNYEKTREKLARIHEKIKNRRRQYLNDIANEIVEEHDIIVTEDLKVNEMLKGKEKGLNKSIIDASFRKICCLIEWKSKIKGKYYYKINSYYPSSLICSRCGY